MKIINKFTSVVASIILLGAFTSVAAECTTIQDGSLLNSDGTLMTTGYNDNGYNYQAHMYNGDWYGSDLIMKWNEAWLSNRDCDFDAKLDRHPGYSSYIGSGAWLTNHQSGKVEVNGKLRKWTYFVKIVAVPSDAYVDGTKWYTVEGIEIGPVIWGQFAIIEEVSNDPSSGTHGILYKSPAGPGLSIYGDED